MNRALRAATMSVLLFSPLALAACSSGQISQTISQARDIKGPEIQVDNLLLRAVQLVYPSSGSFDRGSNAELSMAIANGGLESDTLVGISGPGFDGVRVGEPSSSTSAAPTSGSTPSSSATTRVSIPIPGMSNVYLGDNTPTVTLVGLTSPLTPAQNLPVTFSFQKAGDVTLDVIVGAPSTPLPRTSTYNFHDSEDPSN